MRYITSDLAKVLGITTNTVRRYEEAGFLTPHRDSSNYRSYDDFDIKKAATIRLYRKCGFSHNQISQMLGGNDQKILDCYAEQLEELDHQIERLTRLRHWLKDNKNLITTALELEDSYTIRSCPPLKYIIYSINSQIIDNPKRLAAIKTLMYDAPEVQLIQIYRYQDFICGNYIPHSGIAIKEQDIEKFRMQKFIENNDFVETYPRLECLYLIYHIPAQQFADTVAAKGSFREHLPEIAAYLQQNNYTLAGDLVEFYVNTIGSRVTLMECIPILTPDSSAPSTED